MGLVGGEGDGVVADVAGFGAEVGGPLVFAEVGHGFGDGFEGVPDDHGAGVLFFEEDAAFFYGVVDGEVCGGVEEDPVGFAGGDDVALLGFDLEIVGLVDVAGAVEAGDADLADVGDGEVGVLGFFEGQWSGARVGEFEGHGEGGAEGDAVAEEEIVGPLGAGFGVAFEDKETTTPAGDGVMDSRDHSMRRAKPCMGEAGLPWAGRGSLARGPNQGKQRGTPPRMALPCCQADLLLRKRTSSAPLGRQAATWAPWR